MLLNALINTSNLKVIPEAELRRDIEKMIEQFGDRWRDRQELFSRWLEAAACTVHQIPYRKGVIERDDDFERIEVMYEKATEGLDQDQLRQFGQLLGLVMLYLTGYQKDLFSQIYSSQFFAEESMGQFFSPPDVSYLMAYLNQDEFRERLETLKKDGWGHLTICDDACGAGGLFVGAARVIHGLKFLPQEWVFFEGTDLDRDAFNMAYIQMGLMCHQGEIRHGNSITNEMMEIRPTPTSRLMHQEYQKWRERQRQRHQESLNSPPIDHVGILKESPLYGSFIEFPGISDPSTASAPPDAIPVEAVAVLEKPLESQEPSPTSPPPRKRRVEVNVYRDGEQLTLFEM